MVIIGFIDLNYTTYQQHIISILCILQMCVWYIRWWIQIILFTLPLFLIGLGENVVLYIILSLTHMVVVVHSLYIDGKKNFGIFVYLVVLFENSEPFDADCSAFFIMVTASSSLYTVY